MSAKEQTGTLLEPSMDGAIASAARETAQEEMERLRSELARANADLEQFAYVASHDLQEPLRMVASYTELLARRYKGRLDPDADELIAFAVEGATRMQSLIKDLLAYARAGSRPGSLGVPLLPIDTNAALDQSIFRLQQLIDETSTVVTRGPLPAVPVDFPQMAQLFQNLLGNAIKFRKEGEAPRIHVDATRRPDKWVFSVADNGIGIEPAYADKIFVIFQRLHTREAYPGTGIGLAICKKLVEIRGGRIWVESELNQGATFYFTIPVGREPTSP